MADHETKATRAIADRMAQVEPGTPRYEALEAARRFKTSWIELGGTLQRVLHKKLFAQWGFPSFGSYCQDEIRIKPRTAAKLTASYAFLKDEEPAVLKRDGLKRPIPDLAAVEVKRKAHLDEHLSEEDYRRIREMALDEVPASSLRKEYRQALPEPTSEPPQVAIKKLVEQANRLADGLAAVQGIPRVIIERVLALVDDLRALVEH